MQIINKIESILYRKRLYGFLANIFYFVYKNEYMKNKGEHKAFLLMEPRYGNLGDQAIAYASEQFIKDMLPGYTLICVDEDETPKRIKAIRKACTSDDIIFIQGGGNMGSRYLYIEKMRRFCVRIFRKQRVIVMPVSVCFDAEYNGKIECKKSVGVYSKHKKLTILVRDRYSFEFLRDKGIEDKIYLVPDIVFYLYGKVDIPDYKENGNILVCLRKECESYLGEKGRDKLIIDLFEKVNDVCIYDTTVSRTISHELRELELKSLFNTINNSKLVVTDRMHGMIISAILGVPCIVIKSLDAKIQGSYDWIKNTEYIKILSDSNIENLNEVINQMCIEHDLNNNLDEVLSLFGEAKALILKE